MKGGRFLFFFIYACGMQLDTKRNVPSIGAENFRNILEVKHKMTEHL